MATLACRTCSGSGEVFVGHEPSTYLSEGEGIYVECPVCEGRCYVEEAEFEEFWGSEFMSEADAAEYVTAHQAELEKDFDSWDWLAE